MIKRTQEQWRELFTEHEASGVKAREFCKAREICPNYFSKRKKQLLTETKAETGPSFVPVTYTSQPSPLQLELHFEKIRLKIPVMVQTSWLAELINQLQA